MKTETKKMELSPVQVGLLRIAATIANLRRQLPTNHALQARLAAMAREVTAIARGIN